MDAIGNIFADDPGADFFSPSNLNISCACAIDPQIVPGNRIVSARNRGARRIMT
jgi:hypothetical protein